MCPRLLLIYPAITTKGWRVRRGSLMATVEPLTLAYIAALTPRHWEVRIVDELLEDIPEEYARDLVGLTSLTVTASRAYKIAQHYRERGVPVVMGGVHSSLLPDEASDYVDVVFQGDAEGAWPSLLRDFEAGTLKPSYVGRVATLRDLPVPRRDAYQHRYLVQLVSGSRGCRYRCEFCCVWKLEGGHYRARPPDEVLDELETISSQRPILFTDDNIFTDRDWAITLFQGISDRGLRRSYCIQAPLNIADDEEMLAVLKRSGCIAVCIGFESVSEESLCKLRKGLNLKIGVAHYKEKVSKLHDHGLMSLGTFMFGGDGDGPGIFEQTAEFVLDAGIDIPAFWILTPHPGTDLYNRLAREGRLLYTDFPEDYARYDESTAVFRPLKMTPEQLEEGLRWTVDALGSLRIAARRAWGTWRAVGNPILAAYAFHWSRSSLFGRVMG